MVWWGLFFLVFLKHALVVGSFIPFSILFPSRFFSQVQCFGGPPLGFSKGFSSFSSSFFVFCLAHLLLF